MIRLCQKFRTYKLSDVAVELKEMLCTFCNHPLCSHTPMPGQDRESINSSFLSTRKPALGMYEGLALTSSSLLVFPPISSDCLELMVSARFSDAFMLLSVGKFQDSDTLMLAVANQAMNTIGHFNEEVSEDDTVTVKSRKRKRGKQANAASNGQKRRSKRVSSKKSREEQEKVLKQLKHLKGAKIPVGFGDVESEELDEVKYTDTEYKQVLETTVGFMKKIEAQDSYHTYCLPQVYVCTTYSTCYVHVVE